MAKKFEHPFPDPPAGPIPAEPKILRVGEEPPALDPVPTATKKKPRDVQELDQTTRTVLRIQRLLLRIKDERERAKVMACVNALQSFPLVDGVK